MIVSIYNLNKLIKIIHLMKIQIVIVISVKCNKFIVKLLLPSFLDIKLYKKSGFQDINFFLNLKLTITQLIYKVNWFVLLPWNTLVNFGENFMTMISTNSFYSLWFLNSFFWFLNLLCFTVGLFMTFSIINFLVKLRKKMIALITSSSVNNDSAVQ